MVRTGSSLRSSRLVVALALALLFGGRGAAQDEDDPELVPCPLPVFDSELHTPYKVPNGTFCRARRMAKYWEDHNAHHGQDVELWVAFNDIEDYCDQNNFVEYDPAEHASKRIFGYHCETSVGMQVDDNEGPMYWVGIVLPYSGLPVETAFRRDAVDPAEPPDFSGERMLWLLAVVAVGVLMWILGRKSASK